MAGLLPPPSPHSSALSIQHFCQHDITLKRFGLVVTMFLAAALTAPWVAVIAARMRRIESEHFGVRIDGLKAFVTGASGFLGHPV